MATLLELEAALKNADAAGDMDAARKLAAVVARARQDVTNTVPGAEIEETVIRPREPTIGERLAGAGEAAWALIPGGAAGMAGQIGGTISGLAQPLYDRSVTTANLSDIVEQAAMEGASTLSAPFMPSSEVGQRYTQNIGELLAQTVPAMGLPGEMAQLAAGIRAAAPAARAVSGQIAAPVQRAMRRETAASPVAGESASAASAAAAATPDGSPLPAAAAPDGAPVAVEMTQQETGSLLRKAVSDGYGSAKAKEQLAVAAKINPEAKAAAERLGIDLPADVFSDNPQIRSAAGLARAQVASEAEALWKTTVRQAIDKADDTIKQFDANFVDGTPSPGATSQKILDALGSDRASLNKEATQIYKVVDDAVPRETKVVMTNLKNTLDQVAKEVGVDGMKPQERALLKMIDQNPTYGRLIREKNLIGQAIAGKESTFGNMDAATLKRLYAALAEDQLENVGNIAGEPVRQQLRAANLMYAKERALGNRIVSAFGKEADGSIGNLMRNAISQASKGDANAFRKLMKVVPDDLKKETVSTALASIARSNRAAEGGFGFAEYAKAYRGLRANTPVYSEVIKVLGDDSAKVLRDLYEVSNRITEARAAVHQTGKANQALLESLQAESLLGTIANSPMGKRAISGVVSVVPGAAAIAPDIISALAKGGKDARAAVGNLFASPEFQKLAVEAATKEVVPPVTIKRVALSPAFKKFADSIRLPKSPKIREEWLIGAMQAGIMGNIPEKTEEQP